MTKWPEVAVSLDTGLRLAPIFRKLRGLVITDDLVVAWGIGALILPL